MSTGMQMLAGSVALLVIGAAIGEPARLHPTQVSAAAWLGWVYLVTFGSLIGFTAYIYLLQAVTPARASTYAYVNPLVAVFLGWAVAGEPVTARTLIAAAIILAGVAMITMNVRRGDA
jgi:drug/metabolite transporter (DMT)-like permease